MYDSIILLDHQVLAARADRQTVPPDGSLGCPTMRTRPGLPCLAPALEASPAAACKVQVHGGPCTQDMNPAPERAFGGRPGTNSPAQQRAAAVETVIDAQLATCSGTWIRPTSFFLPAHGAHGEYSGPRYHERSLTRTVLVPRPNRAKQYRLCLTSFVFYFPFYFFHVPGHPLPAQRRRPLLLLTLLLVDLILPSHITARSSLP